MGEVERLKRLSAAATKRPPWEWPIDVSKNGGHVCICTYCPIYHEKDAALAQAAVNALPLFLELEEAVGRLVGTWREADSKFAPEAAPRMPGESEVEAIWQQIQEAGDA